MTASIIILQAPSEIAEKLSNRNKNETFTQSTKKKCKHVNLEEKFNNFFSRRANNN